MTDYSGKAALLLEEYKQRMRCSSSPTMYHDLNQLVDSREVLEFLSRPFSTTEMDLVIKQMPADKAPGPHGFNRYFL